MTVEANNICGSYDRYVLRLWHIYHAYFETDINGLIEKYELKQDNEKIDLTEDIIHRKLSSIIINPADNQDFKLHIVAMTNKKSLKKERLNLAKSIRRSFGYKKNDKAFMNDKFFLSVKGAKYKNIQEDIINFTDAIGHYSKTRHIGDQIILSIENGKGILEYKPFCKEEKLKLIKDADLKTIQMVENIQKTENQLKQLVIESNEQKMGIGQQELTLKKAGEVKEAFESNYYAKKKLLKKKVVMLKRKKYDIKNYKKKIASISTYQTIKAQKIVFENSQIIRRTISSYIVKDRCMIDKMPDELFCILIGNIMSFY